MVTAISRIDLVLHFSLLVAGEEDDYLDRQLGPIHLIKYVYLADLLFSQRREGKTFTGVDWRFYNFGPWSPEINGRIEPALSAIMARRDKFDSQFSENNEFVRWSLRNDRLLEEKQEQLPVIIAPQLKKLIHRFGKDTPALLEFVYRTPPMLKASPNEMLDFAPDGTLQESETSTESKESLANLSRKKQMAFIEKRKQLRSCLADNRESAQLINPAPNPRYDADYESGLEWLESLAGEKITALEGTARFDNSVWKSKTRNSDEVS